MDENQKFDSSKEWTGSMTEDRPVVFKRDSLK